VDLDPGLPQARLNEGFSPVARRSATRSCRLDAAGALTVHFSTEPTRAGISDALQVLVADCVNSMRDSQRSFIVCYPLPASARLYRAGLRTRVGGGRIRQIGDKSLALELEAKATAGWKARLLESMTCFSNNMR